MPFFHNLTGTVFVHEKDSVFPNVNYFFMKDGDRLPDFLSFNLPFDYEIEDNTYDNMMVIHHFKETEELHLYYAKDENNLYHVDKNIKSVCNVSFDEVSDWISRDCCWDAGMVGGSNPILNIHYYIL